MTIIVVILVITVSGKIVHYVFFASHEVEDSELDHEHDIYVS